MFLMEAMVNPTPPGARLDADHPENGVLIPRRNTLEMSGDSYRLNQSKRRARRAPADEQSTASSPP